MTDQPVNVRLYTVAVQKCTGHEYVAQVGWSKNFFYETPYTVTGGIQLAGLEQAPKGIYEKIGLSERGKPWALPIWSVADESYKLLNPW